LNPVTVSEQNCRGAGQGSATITLPPAPRLFGAEVNQGLPDYPLVAGKTTLARVYIGTSVAGSPTRVDRAVLDVTAQSTGRTFSVGAVIPNPLFSNTAQRYTENDNINFYLTGQSLPEDSYHFSARLYSGSALLYTETFNNTSYHFTKTDDLKLLVVLPDFFRYERPLSDLALLSDYLSDLARVYPVRDGWGLLGDPKGIQVSLRLFEPVCDGTF